MNIALWVIQILLAGTFVVAGLTKVSQPKEKLATQASMAYVEDFSQNAIRLIGLLELLAAIGLLLPILTGILPILTPLAALGSALTMAGAVLIHLRRKEYSMISFPLVLMVLAVVLVYGRFVATPL